MEAKCKTVSDPNYPKNIDNSTDVLELVAVVERVLKSDQSIPVVTRHDDYPFE